ncbi:MAG TPA: carboxypeptidase M32 [Chthonomonadaceae bacterium]|nr:carboxypeptidase M32 [Chthonomonadaceae bacterium]
MSDALDQFTRRMAQIKRLSEVAGLLGWDQQTYMPPGAAVGRGEQSAVLYRLIHDMLVGPETEALLSGAERATAGEDPESDAVRMVAAARRDFDRETKVPSDLVAEMSRHRAISHSVWVQARKASDFTAFAPALEKMMELTRRRAECLGYTEHIYDALLDVYEPGMKQADVARTFAELRPALVELTHAIGESSAPVDAALLHRTYPVDVQRTLTLSLAAEFGFDLRRGRQDEAAHPFCSGFNRDDVRITTRFDPDYLGQALYATLHETGHGLYEQGYPPQYDGTPLGAGCSLGIHESQSRLWENLVGRSRAYCEHVFPKLQAAFPEPLAGESAERLYRAVNAVRPSFIRVEADEVTYNLHIMLRFELECALLTGELAVKDLPDAWNAKMEAYFGLTPPSDAEGVLQDVHWSEGLVGYFPTYSIGNLVSGQLWNAIRKAVPDIEEQVRRGAFAELLEWLRANIHRQGRRYLPGELVQRATGEPLTSRYYVEYLRTKFGEIYAL